MAPVLPERTGQFSRFVLPDSSVIPEEEILIEDIVGRINPREPGVLQALRRQLRFEGKAYKTEKAYVGKVKAFMADRGLKRLADFDRGNGNG